MIRPLYTMAAIALLASCAPRSGTQQTSTPSNSQVDLKEAQRLSKLMEKLYNEGKFQEAVPLAEQSLTLREKALGPMHPDVAESLNNVALLHQRQGAYGKAEPLYLRALDITEKALGPKHPDVATCLHNLASLYQDQGAYAKAERLYLRALDTTEKALGPMHIDVATSLSNLALLYQDRGAYAKAEPLMVRALDIAENTIEPMHPDLATYLNNLALLYRAQAAYDKAEPLVKRALDIDEKALGSTHPNVAVKLSLLAQIYRDQGLLGKAEPLLVRALGIDEKAFGPMHPDVAISLNNLALLYQDQGAYGKALPLLARALDVREKGLGPMHPDVAGSLNNLAALYQIQGATDKAEPLYTRALAIAEGALGPMHPQVAASLNNLAYLYQIQGAYGKAEPLYTRALDIVERAFGPTHPEVARSLTNLGNVYEAQGAHGKAEPLYTRALAIAEKVQGPIHPAVATILNSLAELYRRQQAYGKAESLLIRALDIREKALGPTHADVAQSLIHIALFYRDRGAYEKAEPLLVRALDIREKALGPTHPDVATSLDSLALLYGDQGLYEKSEPLWARAAEIREQQLRTELSPIAEPRKRALMTLLRGETFGLVSLHADTIPDSRSALELALTTVLRRKGRILDSLVDNETTLRAHLTPSLRAQLDQLTQSRAELVARLYARGGLRNTADHAAIAALRARIDDLESSLTTASAQFRAEAEPITVPKIQAALPPHAALVEFVRYRRFAPKQTQHWQEERYVAYVVPSHGPPQWVALGAAAPIDAQIDAVLTAMQSEAPTGSAKAALQRLDALVFAPVRTRLAGVSHVILAPDDKLNLVPFDALIDPQGHYALEKYLVSYVTTGRDLLRLAVSHAPRSPAVIVAGPDYGSSPSQGEPGVVSFKPLTGALAEASDLQRYFPTAAVTGGKATKSALAALTGPAMLHIATHGFYARDPGTRPAPAPPPTSRGMFVDGGVSLPRPPQSEDPADTLDRAGLALAGANQSAEGIVTAREIAGFDWWGTQLVVLSACETGLGAVPSGDGVYGLRRALVLAGAESQVVSLWSVGDASTRVLMRDFYAELARGTGRAEALRQAKLRLMRHPRYARLFYWAAFIPAGDWRPLDRSTISHHGRSP